VERSYREHDVIANAFVQIGGDVDGQATSEMWNGGDRRPMEGIGHARNGFGLSASSCRRAILNSSQVPTTKEWCRLAPVVMH